MANDPSFFEYTLKDTQVIAISLAGARFPFSSRIGEHGINPNGESTRGRGSGSRMQYHTGVIFDYEGTFTLPLDESVRFAKWFKANCEADGVCNFEVRRSKPRQRAIVDLAKFALPIQGERTFAEGDATMVEWTYGFLTLEEDTTNAIVA